MIGEKIPDRSDGICWTIPEPKQSDYLMRCERLRFLVAHENLRSFAEIPKPHAAQNFFLTLKDLRPQRLQFLWVSFL
jgi:hypothetical protein